MSGINLDQIIAESQRASLPLTLAGTTYELPGEFPLDVLAPFLAENLDLSAVMADVMRAVNTPAEGATFLDVAVDTLIGHPALPLDLVKAAGDALERLLGAEAYAAFWALRPTVPVVRVLAKELTAHYGVTLLDFSDSDESSPSTGGPSTPTSNASTDATPETSGDAPAIPAGS